MACLHDCDSNPKSNIQQMADCSKKEVKAKSDLDNVLDAVKQEEKEKEATLKSIKNTENLISNKSEVVFYLEL